MNMRRSGLFKRLTVGVAVIASLVFTSFANPMAANASVPNLYVKPGGLNTGNCDSWANGCELRYALLSVAVSGEQIWVEKGTYKPTDTIYTNISFILKDGVAIYGGFNGTEISLSERNPATNVTILSGDIHDSTHLQARSCYVVIGSNTDNTAVLDGFTLEGANKGQFHITANTCSGRTLLSNAPCSITVTFNPTTVGAKTGYINIPDNAAGHPHKIPLSGTGGT